MRKTILIAIAISSSLNLQSFTLVEISQIVVIAVLGGNTCHTGRLIFINDSLYNDLN